MSTTLTAEIGRDRYKTQLQVPNHTWVGDEPESEGGTDFGPNPYEFVLAALATCTCATLRMYADRKGMGLDKVIVTLSMDVEKTGATQVTRITRHLAFEGVINDAERESLLRIAEKCPVHKMFQNEIQIETALV
jgi:putative redox protein